MLLLSCAAWMELTPPMYSRLCHFPLCVLLCSPALLSRSTLRLSSAPPASVLLPYRIGSSTFAATG